MGAGGGGMGQGEGEGGGGGEELIYLKHVLMREGSLIERWACLIWGFRYCLFK